MRKVAAWVPGLGAVIGIALLAACAPMARTPATNGGGTGGGGEPPAAPATPDPAPTTPQETEQRWTLEPPHFGDDDAAIWAETSNRSTPFAWDRITADNADAVEVSIGGHDLPLENREYPPVFADDYSGAEWDLKAEVSPGAVVLVLTAEDRSVFDFVKAVRIDAEGSDYTGAPAVVLPRPTRGTRARGTAVLTPTGVASVTITNQGQCGGQPGVLFGPPQTAGGRRATGVVIKAGLLVGSVDVTHPGSGYTSRPSVAIGSCGGAAGTAVLQGTTVASVRITERGEGYRHGFDGGVSGVYIAPPGGGGTQAEGTVVMGRRGNTQADNLYFARQTLYGKELLIRLATDE